MKVEDFYKTYDELEKEFQMNNNQILISDERKRLSNVNQFEYKATLTIAFSILPYLGLLILSKVLTINGIMSSLIGTIPVESFPFIIVGSSFAVGTIGRKILEWKFITKQRLKAFTTANTQSEKIQEEVKYTIELEKAKNGNKVIQQTINLLNLNQSILDSLSNEYDINKKNIPQTKEEANKAIENLSTLLKDKYTELDILTIQKVLHEKFWKIRVEGQKALDIIMTGMMGGIFTMMYMNMPILIVKDYISSLGLMSLLSSSILGFVGFSGYMIKRYKDYVNAFNYLNNELGENSLPDKLKEPYEEQQNIESKIENKTKEISVVWAQLQEQKRIMESLLKDSNEKTSTINPIMHEYIFTEVEKEEEEKEPQMETKGHPLVLVKKSNNTHPQE